MRTLCALLVFAVASFAGEADDAFAHDLFSRLAVREGNIVCSPLSVRVALAMVYGGAGGPTAEELERILRCDEGIHAAMAALVRDYDGKAKGQIAMPSLADALWVQQGTALLPAYLDLLAKQYGAAPTTLDFRAADEACERINRWVFERTRERIREIVSPEMFNPNTTLVLTNAIHFKAAWQEPFEEDFTKKAPFTLASGEKVDAPLMVVTEHFGYAEKDGAAAVELPYVGRRFSMVVVLPRKGVPEALPEGLVGALKGRNVSVYLPRFKVESAFRLEETLRAMGMDSAFGERADFSGMNGAKNLFVAAVAHKAFIAVDEKGTEAAAATAAVLELKGEPSKPVEFRADRPFLFLIRDRETGSILFLGRVSDPRS